MGRELRRLNALGADDLPMEARSRAKFANKLRHMALSVPPVIAYTTTGAYFLLKRKASAFALLVSTEATLNPAYLTPTCMRPFRQRTK